MTAFAGAAAGGSWQPPGSDFSMSTSEVEIEIQDFKNLTEVERNKLTEAEREVLFRAEEILSLLKRKVSRKYALLFPAISVFEFVPVKEAVLMETDGLHLFYQAQRVLKECSDGTPENLEKQFVHLLLHGLLGHFEQRELLEDHALLDAVMDFEADVLQETLKKYLNQEVSHCSSWMNGYDREMRQKLRGMGSHALYYCAKGSRRVREYLRRTTQGRRLDNHESWNRRTVYSARVRVFAMQAAGEGIHDTMSASEPEQAQLVHGERRMSIMNEIHDTIKARWGEARRLIAGTDASDKEGLRRALNESGMNGQGWGDTAGGSEELVAAAEDNNRSYRDTLSEFFKEKEGFQEQEGTIDRMLYSYGFDLYEDVALIEPEECTEQKQLHTVVIAIDTSGSCSGRVMETFLRETKNLFRDLAEEVKFEQVILMQCDAELQKEEYFTDASQLPDGKEFQTFGYGGTDFRPVFERVEELRKNENAEVDCLLYLSDGYGNYPEKKANYPTFFILTKDSKDVTPDWVKTIYLEDV